MRSRDQETGSTFDRQMRRATCAALAALLGAVALAGSGSPARAQGVDEDEPKPVVDACVLSRSPHFRITEEPGECDASREVSLALGTEAGLLQALQLLVENEEADRRAYADLVAALLAQRDELLREILRLQQEAAAAQREAARVHQAIAASVASVSAEAAALGALASQNSLALEGLEQEVGVVKQDVADLRDAVATVVDRDGDGVPDAEDLCPDQPGVASLHGCPVQ